MLFYNLRFFVEILYLKGASTSSIAPAEKLSNFN